jgi:hypothetical protein
MKALIKFFSTVTSIIIFFSSSCFSQVSVNTEVDIYSRYNWRGLDFGNSPSFQPTLSLNVGSFSIGAWGAYSFYSGGSATYSENDLFATYNIATASIGSFSVIYTDYFYPSSGLDFFNYDINGSHVLEAGLSYSGPNGFPIQLSGYYNFKNDPGKSAYIQLGYPATAGEVSLSFFAGFTPSSSAWYGTSKAEFINLGIAATKNILITEKFSLPLHVTYILNPNLKQSFLIAGLSF